MAQAMIIKRRFNPKQIRPTEDEEQIALFKWIQFQPEIRDHIFHIPNGKQRTKSAGAKLKKMGVRAGVPDLCLAKPRKHFHGLYIELKRIGGINPKGQQASWLKRLQNEGYMATVAYGWEHAKSIILDYMRM